MNIINQTMPSEVYGSAYPFVKLYPQANWIRGVLQAVFYVQRSSPVYLYGASRIESGFTLTFKHCDGTFLGSSVITEQNITYPVLDTDIIRGMIYIDTSLYASLDALTQATKRIILSSQYSTFLPETHVAVSPVPCSSVQIGGVPSTNIWGDSLKVENDTVQFKAYKEPEFTGIKTITITSASGSSNLSVDGKYLWIYSNAGETGSGIPASDIRVVTDKEVILLAGGDSNGTA